MIDSWILVDLAIGGLGVAIVALVGARRAAPRGRMTVAAAAFLPVAAVCLFYSLALHIHHRLGGWPQGIGDRGFPRGLVAHADLAGHAFGALLLGCLFALPIAFLFCACVPRMRPGLRALGLHALTCGAAFAAMQLAPEPFLNWWWD